MKINTEFNLSYFVCLFVPLLVFSILFVSLFVPSVSVAFTPSPTPVSVAAAIPSSTPVSVAAVIPSTTAAPMPFKDVMASVGKGPNLQLNVPRDYTLEQYLQYNRALIVHSVATKRKEDREKKRQRMVDEFDQKEEELEKKENKKEEDRERKRTRMLAEEEVDEEEEERKE